MKTPIKTLLDALAYQLQGLFFAEREVRNEFGLCKQHITSEKVREAIEKYVESSTDKVLKIKRMFNHLMQNRLERKNEIINRLLDETRHMLDYASSPRMKDILMISCMKNLNAYKTAGYRTAYLFAVELELDTVSDLLQQIIEWELQTGKDLDTLFLEEFNKADTALKLQ